MRLLVQWTKAAVEDWQELTFDQWASLPFKPEPVGGEPLDDLEGYIFALNVQGVIFRGADHYHVERLPDGFKVTVWADDPEDRPAEEFWADVWTFKHLAPDPRFGGAYNTRQHCTSYRRGRRLRKGIEDGPHDITEFRNYNEFVPPTSNVRHGVWVEDDKAGEHDNRRSEHGWREWTEGVGAHDVVDGKVVPGRPVGKFDKPEGTRVYYLSNTNQANNAHADDKELAATKTYGSSTGITASFSGAGTAVWTWTTGALGDGHSDWAQGTYRCQLDVTTADTGIQYGFKSLSGAAGHFARLDGFPNYVDAETWTDSTTATGTGLKMFTTGTINPAAGAETDAWECRLAIEYTGSGHGMGPWDFTMNVEDPDSFTDGPWKPFRYTVTFDADVEILAGSIEITFDADTILVDRLTATFDADVIIVDRLTAEFDADTALVDRLTATFDADTVLIARLTAEFDADVYVATRVDPGPTFDADVYVATRVDPGPTFDADTALVDRLTAEFDADVVLLDRLTATFDADAALVDRLTAEFDADAVLVDRLTATFDADAALVDRLTATFDADVIILGVSTIDITFDADTTLVDRLTATFDADTALVDRLTAEFDADTALVDRLTAEFDADVYVATRVDPGPTFDADTTLVDRLTSTFDADTALVDRLTAEFDADTALVDRLTATFDADVILLGAIEITFDADTILVDRLTATFDADVIVVQRQLVVFDADVALVNRFTATFDADANILLRALVEFLADTILVQRIDPGPAFDADTHLVERIDPGPTFDADALLLDRILVTFLADVHIKHRYDVRPQMSQLEQLTPKWPGWPGGDPVTNWEAVGGNTVPGTNDLEYVENEQGWPGALKSDWYGTEMPTANLRVGTIMAILVRHRAWAFDPDPSGSTDTESWVLIRVNATNSQGATRDNSPGLFDGIWRNWEDRFDRDPTRNAPNDYFLWGDLPADSSSRWVQLLTNVLGTLSPPTNAIVRVSEVYVHFMMYREWWDEDNDPATWENVVQGNPGHPAYSPDTAEIGVAHFNADVIVVDRLTATFDADVILVDRITETFDADVIVVDRLTATFDADAALVDRLTATFDADAALVDRLTVEFDADVYVATRVDPGPTFDADVVLVEGQGPERAAEITATAKLIDTVSATVRIKDSVAKTAKLKDSVAKTTKVLTDVSKTARLKDSVAKKARIEQ